MLIRTQWSLQLLGGFQLSDACGEAITPRNGKVVLLLALLALNASKPLHRDTIAKLLWEEDEVTSARAALRVTLSRLRKRLGSLEIVSGDTQLLQLDSTRVQTDIGQLRQLLLKADAAQGGERVRLFEEALALYRGPLLPGFEESWIYFERQRLAGDCLRARRELASFFQQSGDWERAVAQRRLALELEALNENLHQELIQTLTLAGRSGEARQHYREALRLFHRNRLAVSPRFGPLNQEDARAGNTKETARSGSGTGSATLPVETTCFFGREEELKELANLLLSRERRLITLTGIGGIGKSRLAIEVLRHLQIAYWLVPLADYSSVDDLPGALIRALLPESLDRNGDWKGQLIATLGTAPGVLMLDNLEQFPEVQIAEWIQELLQWLPANITLLATSQRRLKLQVEQVFPLSPLDLPAADLSLEQLAAIPSIALFLDRASMLAPSFQLTPANDKSVVGICRLLDGIPMAIEMAAARVSILSPSQICALLTRQSEVLVSRCAGVSPRQRSMLAAMEWSCQLLPEQTLAFLKCLSVFRGGCSLEAAEFVSGTPEKSLECLMDLRDASLVVVDTVYVAREPETRFRLLEVVRAYLRQQLAEQEWKALEERHTQWCFGLAASLDVTTVTGIARVELELENLSSALERCPIDFHDSRYVWLLICVIRHWWHQPLSGVWNHYLSPLVVYLEQGGVRDEWRHRLLWSYSRKCLNVARSQSDIDCRLFSLLEDHSDPRLHMEGLQLRAAFHMGFGSAEEAHTVMQQMLSLSGIPPRGRRPVLIDTGWFLGREGRYQEACTYLEEALELSLPEPEQSWWAGVIECMLASMVLGLNKVAAARAIFRAGESRLIARNDLDSVRGMAGISARISLAEGDYETAVTGLRQFLKDSVSQDIGDVVYSICGLIECAVILKRSNFVLLCLGALENMHSNLGRYYTAFEISQQEKWRAWVAQNDADTTWWEQSVYLPYDDVAELIVRQSELLT